MQENEFRSRRNLVPTVVQEGILSDVGNERNNNKNVWISDE